jgi:hypothetical protein
MIGNNWYSNNLPVIMGMFGDAKRAFYRQAASFPLEKISLTGDSLSRMVPIRFRIPSLGGGWRFRNPDA